MISCGLQAGEVPLKSLVSDYMPGDLETAIVPTPQKAELSDTCVSVKKVAVVANAGAVPAVLLKELGVLFGSNAVVQVEDDTVDVVIRIGLQKELNQAIADKGQDAYLLAVTAAKGNKPAEIVLSGNSASGDLWALATLRQMVFKKDGLCYVRTGRITDYPLMAWRGNKRPAKWEWAYKANASFMWGNPKKPDSRHPDINYRRSLSMAWHHGEPLKATEAEMDELVAGFRVAYTNGCRDFCIKFDDVSWVMSEPTEIKFLKTNKYYDYFTAVNAFINGMHKRIKAIDPANRFWYMPRPYWYNSFELQEYVERIKAAGPIPADVWLFNCGPEVIAWTIPTDCMKAYRELFGFTNKSLIYDNTCRGGELKAFTGRDHDLWKEVEGFFLERGTPVSRITSYDYMWNPEAYDPGRSLMLAVRELSDRDPVLFKAMWDFVSYYNDHRDFPPYTAQEEVRKQLPLIHKTMVAKFETLRPLLRQGETARELNLEFEFWGPLDSKKTSFEFGEYQRLRRLLEFAPYALAYGYQEGRVARIEKPIVVDGKLDEPEWANAKVFPGFVIPCYLYRVPSTNANWDEFRAPTNAATELRMVCDGKTLFIGARLTYPKRPEVSSMMKAVWKDKKPGDTANFAWREPSLEFMFDPEGKRDRYYQLIGNIGGISGSVMCRAGLPRVSGGYWNPAWTFKFNLGETEGYYEASIPVSDLTSTPVTSGTVWGIQVFRSGMGPFSTFTGIRDMIGGEHGTREFGRLVFE